MKNTRQRNLDKFFTSKTKFTTYNKTKEFKASKHTNQLLSMIWKVQSAKFSYKRFLQDGGNQAYVQTKTCGKSMSD